MTLSAQLAAPSNGDSLDWKELPADEICRRVTSKVQPGSIVLFHNAAKHTPEALPAILEKLISDGYTVVPISQLICKGSCGSDYTIDHSGRQFAVQPPVGEPAQPEVQTEGAAPGGASSQAPAPTAGAQKNAA